MVKDGFLSYSCPPWPVQPSTASFSRTGSQNSETIKDGVGVKVQSAELYFQSRTPFLQPAPEETISMPSFAFVFLSVLRLFITCEQKWGLVYKHHGWTRSVFLPPSLNLDPSFSPGATISPALQTDICYFQFHNLLVLSPPHMARHWK